MCCAGTCGTRDDRDGRGDRPTSDAHPYRHTHTRRYTYASTDATGDSYTGPNPGCHPYADSHSDGPPERPQRLPSHRRLRPRRQLTPRRVRQGHPHPHLSRQHQRLMPLLRIRASVIWQLAAPYEWPSPPGWRSCYSAAISSYAGRFEGPPSERANGQLPCRLMPTPSTGGARSPDPCLIRAARLAPLRGSR